MAFLDVTMIADLLTWVGSRSVNAKKEKEEKNKKHESRKVFMTSVGSFVRRLD